VRAIKLQLANRSLLNPAAPQWNKVQAEELRLAGVPLNRQPSKYVRAVWSGRNVGAVRLIRVRAAHNSKFMFFRLEWPDASQDVGYAGGAAFPDAAAVLFSQGEDTPLETMGAPGKPVEAWYWRANQPQQAEDLRAEGLATEETMAGPAIETSAVWEKGHWYVVLCRALAANGTGAADLSPGSRHQVGFLVWEGSHQERGSLYSHSVQWRELTIQ
jgi:DMSO reductase family type II enzyme heme b subunit